LESRRGDDIEFWSLLGENDEPQGKILLPLANDYADFLPRFSETLRAIGVINDWSAAEVEERIAATRADMLLIRLEQAQVDETVPLWQASITLDAIYQMLRESAIAAAAQERVLRGGRIPGAVQTFLDDDVRLAHTRHGSFVFTVTCRLGDLGFSRRVMETMAHGLEASLEFTLGRDVAALPALAKLGLSARFIEHLLAIIAPNELRSLTLQFEWASTLPEPEVGRQPIRLEHSAIAALDRVRRSAAAEVRAARPEESPMAPPEEPQVLRVTLQGQVISLSRDSGGPAEGGSGSAVISAEVDGRKRNVRMELAGSDHDLAIKAYQMKVPLSVTGNLVFERRVWRLTGDLEVNLGQAW
jgi:hypothetical protein